MKISKHPDRKGYFLLESSLFLPQPVDAVFGFFSDAEQLQKITPPWLNFRVVTERPIELHDGTIIDYKLRVHGIPLHWQSRIEQWEPGRRFIDVQTRGPYRTWEHEHTFRARDGGTEIGDRVEYSVYGGTLVHNLFVRRDLKQIFEFRLAALSDIFGNSKLNGGSP